MIRADLLVDLPAPCLVVDFEAAQRNIDQAAAFFCGQRTKLRPHFKAHKCTTLLHRQLAAGQCSGVTCATASEAELLARHGFDNILVANQVVGRLELERLIRAARSSNVTVAVDAHVQVEALADHAARAGIVLGVLIEIDVGMGRCGLAADDPRFLPLATRIAEIPSLELRGLMGYEGHAMFRLNREERRNLVEHSAAILRQHRRLLEGAGLPCPIVSGGGTGTYDLLTYTGAVTEVQAGSYVFMDARYRTLDLPFTPALFCCAFVISRPVPGRAILNAGLKSLSVEYGLPVAVQAGLEVVRLADEHAVVALDPASPIAVGDPVLLLPSHLDPTVNLHDVLFVTLDGAHFDVWPVDGRRRLFEGDTRSA